LETNGSLFSIDSFKELIGFDLGNAVAHGTGSRYGRGLPVPMSVKAPRTACLSVSNFPCC
jgi:hypothetical protein